MNRKLHRAARELGVKGELLFEAERRKHLLANAILMRIREELTERPESDEFSFPLKSSVGKLERFVLSHYPQDISERVHASQMVTLSIDETTEPPVLTVLIGKTQQERGD